MIWREPGENFDAGDRRLRLVLPPIFDGPATRGLFDEKTGVLWAVDSFAALTPGAVHHVEDLPTDLYDESFLFFNSLVSPWHQFLDPVRYDRHVDRVEALKPRRRRQRPRPDPGRRRDPRRLRPGPRPGRRADHRPAGPGGARRDPGGGHRSAGRLRVPTGPPAPPAAQLRGASNWAARPSTIQATSGSIAWSRGRRMLRVSSTSTASPSSSQVGASDPAGAAPRSRRRRSRRTRRRGRRPPRARRPLPRRRW